MASDIQLTPMMAQYQRIKRDLPAGALLFFRLGDFYEMFFEDAQVAAPILNVALTKRGAVPMCGIPFHAANGYIARILKSGRKVAICDQVEEARPGQLVKREVTQILSPGTHFDDRLLTAERNNFVAGIFGSGKIFGLAVVDLTTGDFKVTEVIGDLALTTELERLRPVEIIFPDDQRPLQELLRRTFPIASSHEGWVFALETSLYALRDHFKVASLDGFGLRDRPSAIGAAGGLLHYIGQHLRRDLSHLTRLNCYQATDYLVLDSTTLRTLEVLEPQQESSARTASLYGALNRTATPMGARRLRDWLTQPLASVAAIHQRQSAVQQWLDHPEILEPFRVHLAEVRDLERTLSRLSMGSGNARDLQSLRIALQTMPPVRTLLAPLSSPSTLRLPNFVQEDFIPAPQPTFVPEIDLTQQLTQELAELPTLVDLLTRAIVDEPPLALKDGGMIRDGFNPDLDELRQATRGGKDWIAQLQQKEIETTGIASLKIRFNSVFGYYIEITKSNLDKVPPHYIRKQTVANGERYITPELKDMEGKILGAEERTTKLEYELFQQLRESVIAHLSEIQRTASALAQLDVLAGFAEVARLYQYTRPIVRDEGLILIENGRHPVLDQAVTDERFVPNDTRLDNHQEQIALITGPNMAGKSTYIRQVALLTLLAHTGSFIPAHTARIDLVDRIFTRIGASDDLWRGQSTFMVEMSETANILNNATRRSLIILDEIGRGTSTFDGLSLAWSILEFLHNQVGAKTLFATHYHELTELSARLTRIKNYNVAVREWNEQIIFLRKIVLGGTDKSYGIQVARLAGVPKTVIERAKEILSNLEASELTPEGKPRSTPRHRAERTQLQALPASPQLDLFQ